MVQAYSSTQGGVKSTISDAQQINSASDDLELTGTAKDYGYDNVKDYFNMKTDTLIKKDNYDRYSFDGVVEWWKNKASKRYETLKKDDRLRYDLETWNTNENIEIIR